MSILLRQITASESHYVIDLFNSYRVFYRQPSDKTLAKNFIHQRLANNESIIFVAFKVKDAQTIPVGFTQLYPKYSSARAVKNWILNDLYVDEHFRKLGIGKMLIKKAMDFAKNTSAQFVQLETEHSNFTAQKLYESIGFNKQEPDTQFVLYKIEV